MLQSVKIKGIASSKTNPSDTIYMNCIILLIVKWHWSEVFRMEELQGTRRYLSGIRWSSLQRTTMVLTCLYCRKPLQYHFCKTQIFGDLFQALCTLHVAFGNSSWLLNSAYRKLWSILDDQCQCSTHHYSQSLMCHWVSEITKTGHIDKWALSLLLAFHLRHSSRNPLLHTVSSFPIDSAVVPTCKMHTT